MVILFQFDVNTNRLDSSETESEENFVLDEWLKSMQNHLNDIKNRTEYVKKIIFQ